MHYWLLLLLFWAGYAQGSDYERGMEAFQAQEYSRALAILTPLAQQNDANAQHRIAVMYRHGMGMGVDHQLALDWYKKAADNGHLKAQTSVAAMLYFAMGIKADWPQAAHYWSLAAQQGDGKSQESYGLMLIQGEGGAQNFKKAALWLSMAARQQRPRAQLALGMLLLAGEGIKKMRRAAYSGSRKRPSLIINRHSGRSIKPSMMAYTDSRKMKSVLSFGSGIINGDNPPWLIKPEPLRLIHCRSIMLYNGAN